MCASTYPIRTRPVSAITYFLPSDDRYSSSNHGPRRRLVRCSPPLVALRFLPTVVDIVTPFGVNGSPTCGWRSLQRPLLEGHGTTPTSRRSPGAGLPAPCLTGAGPPSHHRRCRVAIHGPVSSEWYGPEP